MECEGWRLERNTSRLTGEKIGAGPRERCSDDSTASWSGRVTGGPVTGNWRRNSLFILL